MKKGVFPGSFDPITLGHIDIIERALPLFDEIIIAIGSNADKSYMFSLEKRKQFIESIFEGNKKIVVKTYEGMTADFCKIQNAGFIIRGLRNTTDFNYEQAIAQTNLQLSGIESVCLFTSTKYSNISSSIVRDVIRNGGDYSILVPKSVKVEEK